MKFSPIILAAGFLAFAGKTSADSRGDFPLSDLISRSTWGMEGKVVAITADCSSERGCSTYLVRIEIAHVHFGDVGVVDDQVSVCSKNVLEIGHTYHLFATPPEDGTITRDACTAEVPRNGVFEQTGNEVWRVRSYDSRISIPVLGDVYETDRMVYRRFHAELEEAIDQR